MEPNPEKLTCISIIICDDVYRDETTKKLIIVGTFNSIHARELPCRHPRMTVLFTLTNGRGDYDLSLSVESAEDREPIVEIKGPFHSDDPLGIIDVNVQLVGIGFQLEGKYWIVLRADGEIIGQRPFGVNVANTQGADQK